MKVIDFLHDSICFRNLYEIHAKYHSIIIKVYINLGGTFKYRQAQKYVKQYKRAKKLDDYLLKS